MSGSVPAGGSLLGTVGGFTILFTTPGAGFSCSVTLSTTFNVGLSGLVIEDDSGNQGHFLGSGGSVTVSGVTTVASAVLSIPSAVDNGGTQNTAMTLTGGLYINGTGVFADTRPHTQAPAGALTIGDLSVVNTAHFNVACKSGAFNGDSNAVFTIGGNVIISNTAYISLDSNSPGGCTTTATMSGSSWMDTSTSATWGDGTTGSCVGCDASWRFTNPVQVTMQAGSHGTNSEFFDMHVIGPNYMTLQTSALTWSGTLTIEDGGGNAAIVDASGDPAGLAGGIGSNIVFVSHTSSAGRLIACDSHVKARTIDVSATGSHLTLPGDQFNICPSGLNADLNFAYLTVSGPGALEAVGGTIQDIFFNDGGGPDYIQLRGFTNYDKVTPNIRWNMVNPANFPSSSTTQMTFNNLVAIEGKTVMFKDNRGTQFGVVDNTGSVSFSDTGAIIGALSITVPSVGGGCCGGGSTAQPSSNFFNFNDFYFTCPGTLVDWANPLAAQRINESVTFTDNRPQAAVALVYVWNFGDGTGEVTNTGKATHLYTAADRVYHTSVIVQYTDGAIDQFVLAVDTRGTNCAFQGFEHYIVPLIYATAILLAVSAAIVIIGRKKKLLKVSKWMLALAVILFAIPFIIYIYAYLAGIPLG